jgi:hypothetical protein
LALLSLLGALALLSLLGALLLSALPLGALPLLGPLSLLALPLRTLALGRVPLAFSALGEHCGGRQAHRSKDSSKQNGSLHLLLHA